ncbi:hypothetical protein DAMA08_029040 [Martiniozyma asiatica (nom. inval.)]|nr:hypothetical protein DAMA08_029040 [Martiniozyma asiatica]
MLPPMTTQQNTASIPTAYNYAILADEVVEEAALLSTSEGGYMAEYEDYSSDRHPSYNSSLVEDDYEEELDNYNSRGRPIGVINSQYDNSKSSNFQYGSIDDSNSVLSEISDSNLLNEAREDFSLLNWYNKPSVMMASVTMFLYCFSVGLSITSELQLLLYAVCWLKNGEPTNCDSPSVSQANAILVKWTNTCTALIKILISVKISSLSDIYGRKPLLLYSFIMSLISRTSLIFVLTPKFFKIWLYVASQSIDALGGSMFVVLAVANSYVVDVVDERERLKSLGKVSGGLFMGMFAGPFISSVLAVDAQYLLRLSATCISISIILITFILPESRSKKLRDKSRRASMISQKSIKENPTFWSLVGLNSVVESFTSLKLLWVTRISPETGKLDISARINAIYLLTIEILLSCCQIGGAGTIALYCLYWFHWNQKNLGLLIGMASGLRAIVLTWINPIIHEKLLNIFIHDSSKIDFIDLTSILIAVVSYFFGSLICVMWNSTWALLPYVCLVSFSSIGTPTINSALLKYNEKSGDNGRFFGALALIRNLIVLVSPILFLSLYVYSLNHWRPLIFAVMALFTGIAAILIGCLRI